MLQQIPLKNKGQGGPLSISHRPRLYAEVAMTMDQPHYPTTAQKLSGQLFRSTPTQRFGAFEVYCLPSFCTSPCRERICGLCH
ncbi:hypothetical protein AAHA92_24387 [Salvia divinorum]|uniref:Uncharacterized protein n=1 Tax=Salvia divinorum TaxID=28513 RepID=A0ABD1GAC8_SALDI